MRLRLDTHTFFWALIDENRVSVAAKAAIEAQASIEGLTLVTADAKLASFGAPVLW